MDSLSQLSAAPFAAPVPPLPAKSMGGLGVLSALRHDGFKAFPLHCLTKPVVRMRIPGGTLVLANAPEAIRHILLTHDDHYGRMGSGRRVLGPIVGRGLLTSEGEAWRRQRKTLAPAFTPRLVPVMAGHIARGTEASLARMDMALGRPIDLLAAMQQLSLEIAAASMFSVEMTRFGAELRRMVTYFIATIGRPTLGDFLLPGWIPTPLGIRRYRFRQRWVRLVGSIVAERRAQSRPGAPRDLFDLLLEAHGDDREDLLIDEAATMILAGHETTAMTLFWAALLLASAPDWQDAVAAEVCSLDLSSDKAAESLPALKLTQAVVQETLRLYPAVAMIGRRAVKPDTVCGVDVRAGALVLIPLWLLHRNPQLWSASDMFDPGRFLIGGKPGRFVYLPFGVGPHTCIGALLAMTEAVLVLARLVQRFVVLRTDETAVRAVNVLGVTRPDGAPSFELRARPAKRP